MIFWVRSFTAYGPRHMNRDRDRERDRVRDRDRVVWVELDMGMDVGIGMGVRMMRALFSMELLVLGWVAGVFIIAIIWIMIIALVWVMPVILVGMAGVCVMRPGICIPGISIPYR